MPSGFKCVLPPVASAKLIFSALADIFVSPSENSASPDTQRNLFSIYIFIIRMFYKMALYPEKYALIIETLALGC